MTSVEIGSDRIVLRLPDPRILRVLSRSLFLTAAVLSFPWLRAAIVPAQTVSPAPWISDPFVLPMLLRDLQRQGLLKTGDRAVFLGDASVTLPLLKKYEIDPVGWKSVILDCSVDVVVAADGFGDPNLKFIDRVVRIGGVVVVKISADPAQAVRMPVNYRMVYIRRFGATVVAIKKIAHCPPPLPKEAGPIASPIRRRLMAMRMPAKRALLQELEGAMLEPPREGTPVLRTMYLPELMGDDWLDGYARRVFIDASAENDGGIDWFEKNYPKAGREFDIVRVDAAAGAVAKWLRGNVVEDFVVMKAEAGVVEELLGNGGGGVIGFVDELFLECRNEWQKGSGSKRAYWQCVNLYGRLRDEGVAVHQWWG